MQSIAIPRLEDVAGLAAVHVQSWQETYPGLLPEHIIAERTLESRLQMWRSILGSDRAQWCRMARAADGEIIGLMYVSPAFSVDAFADWELGSLYVLAAYHGQGIGRALLAAGLDIARDAGARHVGFWVVRGNVRAERFYLTSGAEKVAERLEPDHIDDGYRITVSA